MNKDKQHSYFISDELLYQFQEYGSIYLVEKPLQLMNFLRNMKLTLALRNSVSV